MKKLFILLVLLLPSWAFCEENEPLMLINPGRETFLNFPSAITDTPKTVTVFLPEPAVPLHGRYPVIYVLGAIPKDAPSAQKCLENAKRKAILVGINFDEQELTDTQKVTDFLAREIVPYIDSNYPTTDDPASRGVAASGSAGAKALAALLAKKNLFTRAVLLNGGTEPVSLAGADASLRILLAGERDQIVVWQQTLEEMHLAYGKDFVTVLGQGKTIFDILDLDYLLAPADELTVKKVKGQVVPDQLPLAGEEEAALSVQAFLTNGKVFDYIPLSLRMSPPYLNWDASSGKLGVISGAVKGKVKLSVFVDKKKFQTKIKLKK